MFALMLNLFNRCAESFLQHIPSMSLEQEFFPFSFPLSPFPFPLSPFPSALMEKKASFLLHELTQYLFSTWNHCELKPRRA